MGALPTASIRLSQKNASYMIVMERGNKECGLLHFKSCRYLAEFKQNFFLCSYTQDMFVPYFGEVDFPPMEFAIATIPQDTGSN